MIEIKIPKTRKCFATFDTHIGGVDMEIAFRGTKIIIEFNQRQWEQFIDTIKQIKFVDAHHGLVNCI